VLVVWRLDRLGRNLRHLIVLLEELEELQALGVAFVSLGEGIDANDTGGGISLRLINLINTAQGILVVPALVVPPRRHAL
jgi:Enterobacteriaceae phage serine recombinase